MIRLIIIKNSIRYDITELVSSITWSGRKGAAPRTLKVTLLDDDASDHSNVLFDCEKGQQCLFSENGEELFRGIITDHSQSSSKKMTFSAADKMYYLANNKDSFCYKNKRADQIFKSCMEKAGMKIGDTVDTKYIIPELAKSKTTYYDVLLDALSATYKATGIRYYISAEKGKIYLRKRKENVIQWVVEVGANITDYTYTKSINGIKTRVKLLSKNDSIVYEKVNKGLEEKIGVFAEVESVDSEFTKAKMKELVESIVEEQGHPTKTLNVSGIGISKAISGGCVYVIIPHLHLKRTFFIDEDTHEYNRNIHTMKLKLNFASDINEAG